MALAAALPGTSSTPYISKWCNSLHLRLYFARSTFGAGGPNQNTSRIRHKEVEPLIVMYIEFWLKRYAPGEEPRVETSAPSTAAEAIAWLRQVSSQSNQDAIKISVVKRMAPPCALLMGYLQNGPVPGLPALHDIFWGASGGGSLANAASRCEAVSRSVNVAAKTAIKAWAKTIWKHSDSNDNGVLEQGEVRKMPRRAQRPEVSPLSVNAFAAPTMARRGIPWDTLYRNIRLVPVFALCVQILTGAGVTKWELECLVVVFGCF